MLLCIVAPHVHKHHNKHPRVSLKSARPRGSVELRKLKGRQHDDSAHHGEWTFYLFIKPTQNRWNGAKPRTFHKEFGFLNFSRETPPPPIKRLFDILWNDPANDPREHSQNIISHHFTMDSVKCCLLCMLLHQDAKLKLVFLDKRVGEAFWHRLFHWHYASSQKKAIHVVISAGPD